MKTKLFTILIAVSVLFFVGCDDDNDVILIDMTPAAPQGVFSVTGDNAVYIYFNGPYESDIDGYIIWRSLEPLTNYGEIGTVDAVSNSNLDLIIYEYIDVAVNNGVTYYYAVSSVDNSGQISELSAEDVFDTPRPEGETILSDAAVNSNVSGYNFAAEARVSATSEVADVFVDRASDIFFINAGDILTDIQDMGFTSSLDDVGWAPEEGWSDIGWFEIIVGHTYVIWTNDNHFAKIRVLSINSISVNFEWAYQTDEGNPELKPVVPTATKPVHGDDYLRKNF